MNTAESFHSARDFLLERGAEGEAVRRTSPLGERES